MDVANVKMGTGLAISVSGTARLQKLQGAKVSASDLVTTPGEKGAHALGRASAATLNAIEEAVQKFSPGSSLRGYQNNSSFYGGAGTYLNIIA